MEKTQTKANDIYEQFLLGTSFLNSLDLNRDIARCINFNEGRQWVTDTDVEEFPKVVVNFVKLLGKVRKSGILQNEYSYLVSTNNVSSIRKIQDFIKHLSMKMRLKAKDLKVVNDTFTKGTGLIYFYWDAEYRDFMSKSGGALKAEALDIRNFRVANPYITNLQEQEWVIYATRERLDSVRAKYGKEVAPDGESNTYLSEKEQANLNADKEFVNIYTKFYRNKEGQVFLVKATKNEILEEAKALNPFYKGPKEEMPNTMTIMDEKEINPKLREEVFNLYPFASLVLEERDNCFYGIPGALEHLESQKSINNHFSVYDKGIQENILGGYAMRKGILGDQEITTENGQILELELKPGERVSDVFNRIPVNNVPSDALNYSGSLLGIVRQTAGVSNIQIGQADFAGQSGKQTEMLMSRARENSSDIALLFNEYKIDQAYIMFLFSKFYYDNEDFTMVEHGFKKDNFRSYQGQDRFNGNDYLNQEVMFNIKVGPAPSFSEYNSMELLGLMVQSGQAPLELYVSNMPEGYVNNKEEMLEIAQNNSKKQLEEMQIRLQEASKIIEQMVTTYKETQEKAKNIDSVINENFKLKEMLAEVAARSIKSTEDASKRTQEMAKEMAEVVNIAKRQMSKTEKK